MARRGYLISVERSMYKEIGGYCWPLLFKVGVYNLNYNRGVLPDFDSIRNIFEIFLLKMLIAVSEVLLKSIPNAL